MSALPFGVRHRRILVRHVTPAADTNGLCHGRLDVEPSAAALRALGPLIRALRSETVTAIHTSPSKRAARTAAVFADALGKVPNIDDRLMEMDFGMLEGCTYDDIAHRFPDLYAAWMSDPTDVSFPGGESFATMGARVQAALAELQATYEGQTVLVVTHGGVVRIAVAAALGLTPAGLFRFDVPYASATVIDTYDETMVVRRLAWNAAEMFAG